MTQITIAGHHVEVTESMTEAVNSKLQKVLNHYPEITTLKVFLSVEKRSQTAEVVAHYLGQDLVAKATSEDLYAALTDLKSKLETSLKKRKATVKSHQSEKLELDEDVA
jgi:putative sigma-54 modulation protein